MTPNQSPFSDPKLLKQLHDEPYAELRSEGKFILRFVSIGTVLVILFIVFERVAG